MSLASAYSPVSGLPPVDSLLLGTLNPSSTKDTRNFPLSGIILQRDQTQATWERLLSTNGAVFNGTSDDAPAIQAALNSLGSDNKAHKVSFPGDGLTGVIGSVNTCSYVDPITSGTPPNSGIVIPSNIALDLRYSTLTVSSAGATAIGSLGNAVSIAGNTNIANDVYMHMMVWENGQISGVGVKYSLFLGNHAAGRGPERSVLRAINVSGATNGVFYGDFMYFVKAQDCRWSALSSGSGSCVSWANSNGGENYSFDHVVFDGAAVGTSTLIGVQAQSFSDAYFYGCSFDFLKAWLFINTSAVVNISLYGCHYELPTSNTAWTSGSSYFRIADNAGAPQAINLFGGIVQQNAGGSGTQIPYIFHPGTTGASAPYGITLDRVQRSLQSGTVLNNSSATVRFIDNQ